MSTTQQLGVPEILPTINGVVVCGTFVKRPESIAPSQWAAFWERAANDKPFWRSTHAPLTR